MGQLADLSGGRAAAFPAGPALPWVGGTMAGCMDQPCWFGIHRRPRPPPSSTPFRVARCAQQRQRIPGRAHQHRLCRPARTRPCPELGEQGNVRVRRARERRPARSGAVLPSRRSGPRSHGAATAVTADVKVGHDHLPSGPPRPRGSTSGRRSVHHAPASSRLRSFESSTQILRRSGAESSASSARVQAELLPCRRRIVEEPLDARGEVGDLELAVRVGSRTATQSATCCAFRAQTALSSPSTCVSSRFLVARSIRSRQAVNDTGEHDHDEHQLAEVAPVARP